MSDFEQRLEHELRRAIAAHEAPRAERWTISVPRPRGPQLAAVAAVVVALVIGIGVGRQSDDVERAAVPPATVLPEGTFSSAGGKITGQPESERLELWVRSTSVRLTLLGEEPYSLLLGFVETRGDQLKLQIDAARARTSDFDDPRCRQVGTYRFAARGNELRFVLVKDPCPTRSDALTGRVWRR